MLDRLNTRWGHKLKLQAAKALTACVFFLLITTASAAEPPVYRYQQANGITAFSDRAPKDRPYQRLRFDCFACSSYSTENWHTTPLFLQQYQQEISRAATEYQLDPALLRAVIHAESAFNPKALSKSGAAGLMQLMPDTATEVGVTNVWHQQQNIQGGASYLSSLLQRYKGDIKLAMAAYNAGPGAVDKHQGIPPYTETQVYVERVLLLWSRYQKAS
ncbi:lytic transglycosylase domain-containing protein [Rheinheimera mesophila]|uniref:Lytic transglycosylase domain-containing protein n=1 Tax=Rheinheimera mesophila TaxID=1547515 RepID=A0A3P3QGM5_9GAMM|nr:lytic transglycosylase [Rheinheimera mesophila]RRJ19483.1 lytic transglycosylase domain-containing protein [Rheinheimera mesophila]